MRIGANKLELDLGRRQFCPEGAILDSVLRLRDRKTSTMESG
ncbi:MAG: hypothetical protein ABSC03_09460 [Verrucomicrobiota bacterium]|jgi:hypothetical protein